MYASSASHRPRLCPSAAGVVDDTAPTEEHMRANCAASFIRAVTLHVTRRALGVVLVGTSLVLSGVVIGPGPARAVEVGESAPEFTLPSTTGADISLRDFRGKTFVLLEFYGGDFHPT
jgi:peroxiredoxin Q/BCP